MMILLFTAILSCLLLSCTECTGDGKLRVCYFSTWARYRAAPFNMQPEHVDPRMCTHVILAFAWITDGNLTLHSKQDDQTLIFGLTDLKKINPKLKVLVAVGGWNFGSAPFQAITATKKSRIRFVKSAVEFLHHWRLDGLDLDWEYPDWEDRDKFTMLVKLLNRAFTRDSKRYSKEKFLLTAAVTAASSKMGGYNVEAIKHAFDFINVMTYDLNGPWANNTGHNAALESWDKLNVKAGIALWVSKGVPKEKIVVGIPMYGHSFRLIKNWSSDVGTKSFGGVAGPITREKGFFAYYEVCDMLAQEDTEVYWDEHAKVPYAVNNDTWVSYDDEKSVKLKVEWTLAEGYGGVMVWSLAMDDFDGSVCRPNTTFPLLKSINVAMGVNITEYSEPVGGDFDGIITVSQRRKAAWTPEEKWEETESASAGGSTPQEWDKGDECDWNSIRPHKSNDCTHFLVCERGYLHEFQCPDRLAFNEQFGICMWPWEVKGCGHMTKLHELNSKKDGDNAENATTTAPEVQEIIKTSVKVPKSNALPEKKQKVPGLTSSTEWPERVFHTVSPSPNDITVPILIQNARKDQTSS